MSVTDSAPPRTDPPPEPGRRLSELPRPSRTGLLLAAAGVAAALAVFLIWRTYPNYDTYYTLIWGRELWGGSLPDYEVFRSPTPHPLSTFVATLLAPLDGSDRLLVLFSLLGYVGFLAILYAFTQRLLGRLIAVLALIVLLTRTDMHIFALRAMFDLPFYLFVFGAALLELRRPRIGWPVLALLFLAGLLRPEAWLLGGVYWLYLAAAMPRRDAAKLLPLVVGAPLLWMAWDLIVTGEPLYSLTSTRELSDEVGRNHGLGDAIANIVSYSGGNDRILTVGVGGLGLLLAVYILRRRAALPLALGGLGVATFLIIAAAGLSVIPRYLTIPSLLLSLCVAVALGGWTLVTDPRARRVAIGIAVVSLAVIGWRAQYYWDDFQTLEYQASWVQDQHEDLHDLLGKPGVPAALGDCRPITVPTHSAIPVLRFETGLPKGALEPSIAQERAPRAGLQLVGAAYNFEPTTNRGVTARPRVVVRKPWSTRPARGFDELAATPQWTLYARCPAAGRP